MGNFIEHDENGQEVGFYVGYFENDKREDERPFYFQHNEKEQRNKCGESSMADSMYTWANKVKDRKQVEQNCFYIGQWKDNQMHGKGFLDMVKYKYEGNFKVSKKDGYGSLTLENQDWYQGQFQDNKFNGKGEFHFTETGDLYNGDWINGQYEGTGELVFTGGLLKFNGQFKNGMKNGHGKLYKKKGPNNYELVQEGQWKNDEYQSQI